jgi:hypothetical protein
MMSFLKLAAEKKDIIFDGHLKQILALLVLSELYLCVDHVIFEV